MHWNNSMKLKKTLLIALSLLMCISFAACATEIETPESSDRVSESISDTEPFDDYLPLYEGEVGAKVVYNPYADSDTLAIATKLVSSLKRMGIATHDDKAAVSTDDHESIEILVADTGYSESDEAYASLGYGEARACVIGNKVVLVGFDKASLEKAVETFLYAIKECKDENGGLRIPRNYSETVVSNEKAANLPVLQDGNFSSLNSTGDNCYMLTIEKVEKSGAEKYLEEVVSAGYVLCAENTIENNIFKIYRKDDDALTVIYLENLKTVRLLVEPISNTELEIMNEDTSYVKGSYDVTITQLGLVYESDEHIADYYTSGMSYVMRLDDGSFIVIDGGYEKQSDADRIYETMKKQAGGDNVTVAAWIFTHLHSDHVEVFLPFSKTYHDKVTIERFIYNKPGGDILGGHVDSHAYVSTAIKTYYPNAKVIKAHAGNKYYLRSVEVEILYTLDIGFSKLSNYNNSSLVFRINTEGKQLMMLGDYSESSPVLMKIYTEKTLKSDVVQVAHHGISDGNNPLNTTIGAEYALWPVSGLQLKTYWESNPKNMDLTKHFFNNYFINMDQSKVFVAGNDVVVMTLAGDIAVTVYDNFDNYLANIPN